MLKHRELFRKSYVVISIVVIVVVLITIGLRRGGYLEFLELAAYDLFVRVTPKITREDPRVTVIEVTEADIKAIGQWPLTDGLIAQGLRTLLAAQPRTIGLDIYRDIPVPPGTDDFYRLLVDNPIIIGIMTVGEKGIAPPPAIKHTEQAAFGDIVVDPGGVVRRALLFMDDGKNSYTSFAFRLAMLYMACEGVALQPDALNPQHVKLQNRTVRPLEENDGGYWNADARGYQFLIDFKNTGVPLRTYSFTELLAKRIPKEAIEGRIILIGVNSQSVKDHFFTALSRKKTGEQQLSGIQLHGQIASQILRIALDNAAPIKVPTESQKYLWILAWGLAGGILCFKVNSVRRVTLFIACGLIGLVGLDYLAFLRSWWLPLVPPGLSFFATGGIVTAIMIGMEKKDRAMLMQLFSKHVSKEIADLIWQQRDDFLYNGRPLSRKMTATVLFSDIKGFTTISEKMDPQEVIDWLNTYMEAMAGLIMKYDGVVDNFVGDGIKADFGVPLARERDDEIRADAVNAVSCALAMEKEVLRINETCRAKKLPDLGIRVGIFTGPVVAGLLGSSQRLKYTTIGDTVNIASRLESYDKDVCHDLPCRILVGDTTLELLGDRFVTEKIGVVSLKGKDERETVYRVLGENPICTTTMKMEGSQ